MDTPHQPGSLSVSASRVDHRESICRRAGTSIAISTHASQHNDALNPVELMLASLAGCLIKGVDMASPALNFSLRGVHVVVDGLRQDIPPRLTGIRYQLIIDTDEPASRIQQLHQLLLRHSTICNTLSPGLPVTGTVTRARDVTGNQ